MALRCHGEALEINERHGFHLGAAYARYGLGEAHVAAGRPSEVISEIESAVEGFKRAGATGPIAGVYAALSRAYLLQGSIPEAAEAVDRALEIDAASAGRESQRQHVSFAAYRVRKAEDREDAARDHLDDAKAALMHQASRLPTADRLAFIQRLETNVEVLAAMEDRRETRSVRLVARDTPLGRPLVDKDYRDVEWTISAPEDDAFPEPALRRQHVLARLLQEAGAQGAAPTDADLAAALAGEVKSVMSESGSRWI